MSDKVEYILEFSILTFVVVLIILAIILFRGGRSKEMAATLRAIKKVDDSVEGMRSQNSAEHGDFQSSARGIIGHLSVLRDRFGFLKTRDELSREANPEKTRDKGDVP